MVADKESCSSENLQGVANELRKLADQIETGQVQVGGVPLSLCNAVSLKLKQKLTGGQVKFDISLTASLRVEQSSHLLKTDVLDITQDVKSTPSKTDNKQRPYEAKRLKKRLSQLWKDITSAINASQPPDTALQTEFLQICQEYGHTADEVWHPLWQETLAAMKHLLELVNAQKFQEAAVVLETINAQKKACHKKFK